MRQTAVTSNTSAGVPPTYTENHKTVSSSRAHTSAVLGPVSHLQTAIVGTKAAFFPPQQLPCSFTGNNDTAHCPVTCTALRSWHTKIIVSKLMLGLCYTETFTHFYCQYRGHRRLLYVSKDRSFDALMSCLI